MAGLEDLRPESLDERLLEIAGIIDELGWSVKTQIFIANKYSVTTRCVRKWVKKLAEEMYGKGDDDEEIDWKTRRIMFLEKLKEKTDEAFKDEKTFHAGFAGMNLWAKVEGFDRGVPDAGSSESGDGQEDLGSAVGEVLASLGIVAGETAESDPKA